MSSGLVVIELERNARLREPRHSGFEATRRQAGHVGNGNSVHMCVASYTTVAPDAEPEGCQTAPGLTAQFHPHLNLHPVSRWSCYQTINLNQSVTLAVARRRALLTTEI